MSVKAGETWFYWLVPVNTTGIPGDKSTPRSSLFPAPQGMVWFPNAEFPAAGDPMWPVDEATFALTQEYTTLRDGNKKASLVVSGESPVNSFLPDFAPPTIGSASHSSGVGGVLTADVYYMGIVAFNAAFKFAPPSNVISVDTLAHPNSTITLSGITWPTGTWAGYVLFAGRASEKLMTAQVEVTSGTLPAEIVWSTPYQRARWTFPNANFDKLRVKGKQVVHDGVDGVTITAVTSTTIVCQDLATLGDDWASFPLPHKRVCSVIADASDGTAALWNFSITGYNDSTGTFTVTPNPAAAGVEPGDVLIIRAHGVSAGADWIEDPKWASGHYPTGMVTDYETVNLVRCIAGTGRYQVRRIIANTGVRITVDRPWDFMPDPTTVFIVEAAGWEYEADGPAIAAATREPTMIRLPCDNMLDKAVLVCVTGVDKFGNESPEDYFSPFRSIWMHGEPPGVRVIVPVGVDYIYHVELGDRTLLVDAATDDVTIQLPPAVNLMGLELVITRIDDVLANQVLIKAYGDELLQGDVPEIELTAQNQIFRLVSVGEGG